MSNPLFAQAAADILGDPSMRCEGEWKALNGEVQPLTGTFAERPALPVGGDIRSQTHYGPTFRILAGAVTVQGGEELTVQGRTFSVRQGDRSRDGSTILLNLDPRY